MINRKCLLASGIAAAVFAMSSAGAAVLLPNNPGVAAQPSFPAPNGGVVVLYDQTDNAAANGAPVQNFEASYDAYDSEAADDFVVPAGGWTVDSFNLVTTVGLALTTTASVNVYPDAGGTPGAVATCSSPAATALVSATATTLSLSSPCALGAGTYWVAVTVDVDFGTNGQIFWSNRSVASNSLAVWRNPGDGFGSGCTNWVSMATCTGIGGNQPDFLFQVLGTAGGGGTPLAPSIELPTLGQWSMLFSAFGLAMIGMFGLRRRSRR